MPTTMFNWLTATSRPRRRAGAISVMYTGDTTDAPPTATPPIQRKNSSAYQSQAKAQPTADTKYRTANTVNTGRRPHQSEGRPTNRAPNNVPISALATVQPFMLSEREYKSRRVSVVPEITAVSNPNRNDPNAAMIALVNNTARPRLWAAWP